MKIKKPIKLVIRDNNEKRNKKYSNVFIIFKKRK